jgi:hypothetical protein
MGQVATLQYGGKRLQARFSGTPVVLEVRDISRPANPLDSANPGTRQLLARALPDADGRWSLNVRFSRD